MTTVARSRRTRHRRAGVVGVAALLLAACAGGDDTIPRDAAGTATTPADDSADAPADEPTTSTAAPTNEGTVGSGPTSATLSGDEIEERFDDTTILVRPERPVAPLHDELLGSNVPVWILPDVLGDPAFHDAVRGLGTSVLRFPGGSWSNEYEWAGCEFEPESDCPVPWASSVSDLLGLLTATERPGMWTVAFNRTPEEAAAAVAFFNGAVDDDHQIGTDRDGREWGTVGFWAQRRVDLGYPEPVRIDHWEIGNEIYGAVAGAEGDCAPWGWENVWSCRPEDYVLGDDEHAGFLDFREAIVAVDPTVEVGAIGIGARGEWSDWDDTVMELAGDAIDFYVVHHYGSNGDLSAEELLDVPARAWPRIGEEVRDALEDNGLDPALPIAVTEHNMVAFLDGDEERHMTSAANAFYLADTIGQFALNGVDLANQWLLVNGPLENGTNYALIDPNGMRRTPAYYGMALWARAGDELVETAVGDDLGDLTVFGVRDGDGSPRLLVLNPTDRAVSASVLTSSAGGTTVSADVVTAESLGAFEVSFNGSTSPNTDLTTPAAAEITAGPDGFDHDFPPFSITLLRWSPAT